MWDDALATSSEQPRDAKHWTDGKQNIFINAWNNNRRSNAFAYADTGYKVSWLSFISQSTSELKFSEFYFMIREVSGNIPANQWQSLT